jgi:hypothetical protein
MTLIVEEDQLSFERLLGIREVPPKLLKEYSLRLAMYHKDGGTGPLGTMALIDCVRYCGFKSVYEEQSPQDETDWDKVKRNTRVEALYSGVWMPGKFVGFGESRVILVQLDDDEFIKECRKHMVRVAKDQKARKAPEPKPAEPLPPARIEPEDIPAAYAAEYMEQPLEPGEASHEVDPGQPAWQPKEMDWTTAKQGDEVWVDGVLDDVADGSFVSTAGDGQIVVLIAGQQYTVPADKVTHAAPAAA